MQLGDLLVVIMAFAAFLAIFFITKANNQAWHDGYDTGYEKGYQDAILDGLDVKKAA